MKYVCTKKCFFRDRVWVPGEILVPKIGEKVVKHFKVVGSAAALQATKAPVADDPTTLKGIQDRDIEANKNMKGFASRPEEKGVEAKKETVDFLS